MESPSRSRFAWPDIFAGAGAVLITSGVALMHVPSSLIVGGLLLLVGAVLAARPA